MITNKIINLGLKSPLIVPFQIWIIMKPVCDYCGLITDCLFLTKAAAVKQKKSTLVDVIFAHIENREIPKSGRNFAITQMQKRN